MRSRRHPGVPERDADRPQTLEPQRDGRRRAHRLAVVGIGPGSLEHLTLRAREVLLAADCVAGYGLYLDLIAPLVAGTADAALGHDAKEVERVESAIVTAMSGRSCALVSSGDPGIYAMAGLVFETCARKGIRVVRPQTEDAEAEDGSALQVEVVPGVPALCAGAALLGAPLTHDFAVVSLSDLLTPWERIAERLEAAARADFVVVIYNPRSRKRDWQLRRARDILLAHRPPETPVGIVRAAMRPDQDVRIVSLAELDPAAVDMQTVLFVGSRSSGRYLEFMYTPRGYAGKYAIG
ncbi:MAG: precorrin-3B C(17)-methyltransferase [Desulfobacterales bacterium]|nr:precorrin-3B C(17)-methyltransferase [Desulfobacterales bacterium]